MIKVGWVHYGMAGASLLQWVVKFCYGGCGLAVAAGATEDAGWRCSGAQESLSGTRFFSGFFFFFLLSHLLELLDQNCASFRGAPGKHKSKSDHLGICLYKSYDISYPSL